LSRTQPTSQVAPFASIRSSQIELRPKQKSHTDDIPVTPSPRPQFSQIHSFPPHSFLYPEFTEQQGQRVGEFLVLPLRPPVSSPSGPPLGPPPPPGPLVPSPPALPSQGRSCRALPRHRTGHQRRPWLCRVRWHYPPGRPCCGRVCPRRLRRRVRFARKTPPPLFRSSPPPMLRVLAQLQPPRIVQSHRGNRYRSRLGRHPRPASDMFLPSSVVWFLCCSLAAAAERPPGRPPHHRPGARGRWLQRSSRPR
jgi:hypothetical protein